MLHNRRVPAPQLDLASVLLKTYLFEDFSPAELEPLARAATLRTAVRGEYIFHVGDPADAIYVVASGQLKDSIATEDGDEVVYNLWGPRMVVGEPGFFAPERNRVMALVALEPTTLLVLRREDLLPFLARHPAPLMRLLEHLASVARASTEIILALARRPLADRLLLRLLDLAETSERERQGPAVTPKVSQANLAAMVGSSRENVNRALARLVAEGTLRIEGGRYVIIDPERARNEVASGRPIQTDPNRRSGAPA
jgi:CRP/FNR family transcriptional regulator, cyclic AMP receptor protein